MLPWVPGSTFLELSVEVRCEISQGHGAGVGKGLVEGGEGLKPQGFKSPGH